MTKTKAQLRAEAVERLTELNEHGYWKFPVHVALCGRDVPNVDEERTIIADLLTDDCGSCYSCAKLAELRAENSQLRVANEVYAQEIGAADGGSAPNDIGSVSWFDILKANGVELGKAPKSSETESRVITSHNELFEALEEREADSREKPLENHQNMALQGWNHILLDAPENQLFVLDEDNMRRLYHIGFMDCKEGQYNMPAHGLNNIEYIALSDYESKRQYRDQQKRSMDVDSENDNRVKVDEQRDSNGTCPDAMGQSSNISENLGLSQDSEIDSREKLESDVNEFVINNLERGLLTYGAIMKLLDRQEAITERERERHWLEIVGASANCNLELTNRNAELQKQNGKLREKVMHQSEQLADVQDALHKRNEEIKPKWEKRLKKAQKENAELQARVDELERENARLSSDELHWRSEADSGDAIRDARMSKLLSQRDELQAAYDAMVGKCAELCVLAGFSMVDASGEVVS